MRHDQALTRRRARGQGTRSFLGKAGRFVRRDPRVPDGTPCRPREEEGAGAEQHPLVHPWSSHRPDRHRHPVRQMARAQVLGRRHVAGAGRSGGASAASCRRLGCGRAIVLMKAASPGVVRPVLAQQSTASVCAPATAPNALRPCTPRSTCWSSSAMRPTPALPLLPKVTNFIFSRSRSTTIDATSTITRGNVDGRPIHIWPGVLIANSQASTYCRLIFDDMLIS